jgi:hypothetical protein
VPGISEPVPALRSRFDYFAGKPRDEIGDGLGIVSARSDPGGQSEGIPEIHCPGRARSRVLTREREEALSALEVVGLERKLAVHQ